MEKQGEIPGSKSKDIVNPVKAQIEVTELTALANIVIHTHEDMQTAADLLVRYRNKRKEYEDAFAKPIKLLKDQAKELETQRNKFTGPIAAAELLVGAEILRARARATEIANKLQQKLNDRQDAKVEKAIATGKPIENIPPAAVVDAPAKSVSTDTGTLGARKKEMWSLKAAPQVFHSELEKKPDLYRDDERAAGIPDWAFKVDWTKINKCVVAKVGVPDCIKTWTGETLAVTK